MRRPSTPILLALTVAACASPPPPSPPTPSISPALSPPAAKITRAARAVVDPLQIGQISSLAFAPTGDMLAVATGDTQIRLYDARKGRLRAVLSKPPMVARHLAFGPGGKKLAVAGDNEIAIWDLGRGEVESKLSISRSGSTFYTIAWSPDGKTLAAGYVRNVYRWDMANLSPLPTLSTPGWAHGLGFSPDSRELAVADEDGVLSVFGEGASPRFTVKKMSGGAVPFYEARFSPDGKTIAVVGLGPIEIVDVATGKVRALVSERDGVLVDLAFDPTGKRIASYRNSALAIYDATTYERREVFPDPSPRSRMGFLSDAVAWSADGAVIATGRYFSLNLWDAASGKQISRLLEGDLATGHENPDLVRFSPDGALLLDIFVGARLWDAKTGKLRFAWSPGPGDFVMAGSLSPDGTRLAIATSTSEVRLVDLASGRTLTHQIASGGPIPCVRFVDDTTIAITAEFEPKKRIALDGRTLAPLPESKSPRCVPEERAQPRGRLAVSLPEVRIFDAVSGAVRGSMGGYTPAAAWRPDGQSIAYGTQDAIRFASGPAWKPRHPSIAIADVGMPSAISFTPEGSHLAATFGAELRLWDLASRERVATHTLDRASNAIAMSPQGGFVAVPGAHGVRLIRLADGAAIRLRAFKDASALALTDAGCVDGDAAALAHVAVRLGDDLLKSELRPILDLDGAARCPGLHASFLEGKPLPAPPAYVGEAKP